MAELSAATLAVEGFRLIGREKRVVAAWAVIYLAALILGLGVIFAAVGPVFATMLTPGTTPDPEVIGAIMKPMFVAYAVLLPLGLLAQAVIVCAVYRAILRPDDRAFFYLRIGADEFRMLLVSILLLLIAGLSFFLVILGVAGAAAAVPGSGTKFLIGFGGGLAGLSLLAWIGVRLCLATPMTFARRRVHLFGSWALTRGRFWPLFGAFLLAFVLTILVSVFMQIIIGIIVTLSGGALTGLLQSGGRLDPATLVGLAPLAVAYLVVATITSLLQLLIYLAPLAAAYREIAVDPIAMADTFA